MKPTITIAVAGLAAALTVGLAAPMVTSAAPAPERRAAYQPSLQASKDAVVAGKKLVLSGKVRPAAKGTRVIVQKKIGDRKWAKEKVVRTTKKGAFSYTDKPGTPGERRYRVVVPRAGQVKAGRSKPVKVAVLKWYPLANLPVRAQQGTWAGGSVRIGGQQYANSVASASGAAAGTMDWNLDPSCTTLRTRFGASDDSDADATAHITLAGDTEQLYAGQFMLTQSESRTFDVSDVFRLAFTWSSTKPGVSEPQRGAIATMAGPEVLCAL